MVRPTSTGEAEILTIKQVAGYLQVTERTIYRLAAANGIPAFKVGGSWRFRRADLDQWIAHRIGMLGAAADRQGAGMSASASRPSPVALPTCTGTRSLRAHDLWNAFGTREGSE